VGFRDRAPEFNKAGVEVIGISYDTPEDNKRFAEDHGFEFPVLSDVAEETSESYETRRADDDKWSGIPFRSSYLIDPEGRIYKAYMVKDVRTHPQEVLDDIHQALAERG